MFFYALQFDGFPERDVDTTSITMRNVLISTANTACPVPVAIMHLF